MKCINRTSKVTHEHASQVIQLVQIRCHEENSGFAPPFVVRCFHFRTFVISRDTFGELLESQIWLDASMRNHFNKTSQLIILSVFMTGQFSFHFELGIIYYCYGGDVFALDRRTKRNLRETEVLVLLCNLMHDVVGIFLRWISYGDIENNALRRKKTRVFHEVIIAPTAMRLLLIDTRKEIGEQIQLRAMLFLYARGFLPNPPRCWHSLPKGLPTRFVLLCFNAHISWYVIVVSRGTSLLSSISNPLPSYVIFFLRLVWVLLNQSTENGNLNESVHRFPVESLPEYC